MFNAGVGYYWIKFKDTNAGWTIGRFEGGIYPVTVIGSDEIYKVERFSESILITTRDEPVKLC